MPAGVMVSVVGLRCSIAAFRDSLRCLVFDEEEEEEEVRRLVSTEAFCLLLFMFCWAVQML